MLRFIGARALLESAHIEHKNTYERPDLKPLKNASSSTFPSFIARFHNRREQPESLLRKLLDHSRYQTRQDLDDGVVCMTNTGSDLRECGIPLEGVRCKYWSQPHY